MNPFFPMPDFQSLQGQRPAMEPAPIYQPRSSGYMGIYNKPPTQVSPALSPVIQGMESSLEDSGGDSTGTGFSSANYAPPGTGFNVLGNTGAVLGLGTGIPGLSSAGNLAGAYAANQALASLGLPANVSYGQAAMSGMLGPLGSALGFQSPQASFDNALSMAIANSSLGMTPDETAAIIQERLAAMAGPSTAQEYGAQVTSGQRSATGALFDSINDYNTVGRMSEIIAAIDAAEAARAGREEGQREMQEAGAGIDASAAADADAAAGRGSEWAEGGYIPGDSGGMDDDVPAIIDGKEPARLSSGEFVFDAATVAALGDGNNQAGAKKLDGLRKAIRKKAYGHERQPPQNYSLGDLVRAYDRGR